MWPVANAVVVDETTEAAVDAGVDDTAVASGSRIMVGIFDVVQKCIVEVGSGEGIGVDEWVGANSSDVVERSDDACRGVAGGRGVVVGGGVVVVTKYVVLRGGAVVAGLNSITAT
jgi:hypothetical protein